MNDYSLGFRPEEYKGDDARTLNVQGRFSRANYEANSKFTSIEKLKACLESTELWNLPCIREKFQEDNDTDEEEDGNNCYAHPNQ